MRNRLHLAFAVLLLAAAAWGTWRAVRPGTGQGDPANPDTAPGFKNAVHDHGFAKAYASVWWKLPAWLQARLPPGDGVPAQRSRINAMIRVLKAETPGQSMERLLTDDAQYSQPGYHSSVLGAQLDLETMLSSRRCIKVLTELAKVNPSQRESNCRQLFLRVFNAHTNALEENLRTVDDPKRPLQKLSMRSTHMAVCAAIFAAADLGYADLVSEELLQVDRLVARFDAQVGARTPALPPGAAISTRRLCGADNRFVLNVLYLCAQRATDKHRSVEQIEQECSRLDMQKSQMPIVPWNAGTTWFEGLVGRPMDRSKRVKIYSVYNWNIRDLNANFAGQNELLSRVRLILFP
jgi:hypothetical protein